MKGQRGGLGRGLEALIPRGDRGVLQVDTASIRPNPRQPRESLDRAALDELAESIRQHGVIQPLIVSVSDDGYTLIAGERRWRAARLAGLETVPVIVKEVTPRQQLELALVENVQRHDLNPIEMAHAYRQLIDEHGLTQDSVAGRVGKNRSTVANTLRLLRLPREALNALSAGEISEGHARALLICPLEEQQVRLLERVLGGALSVRQTESLARRLAHTPPVEAQSRGAPTPDADLAAVETRLRELLGTKVELRGGRAGGRLVIHYYSDEELDALLDRFLPGSLD